LEEQVMRTHRIRTIDDWNLNRRELLAALGVGAGAALLPRVPTGAQSPEASPAASPLARVESLTIDLGSEPSTLDPAQVYDPHGWSIVH
jgi:hypothetical protein